MSSVLRQRTAAALPLLPPPPPSPSTLPRHNTCVVARAHPVCAFPLGRSVRWCVRCVTQFRLRMLQDLSAAARPAPVPRTRHTVAGPVEGLRVHARLLAQPKATRARQSCRTTHGGTVRTAGALHGRRHGGRPQGRGPRHQPRAGWRCAAAQGWPDEPAGITLSPRGNGEVLPCMSSAGDGAGGPWLRKRGPDW